jgi:hypothetical protein
VPRRGIDTAVVVSIDEWHKLKDKNRLTSKDVLLGESSRLEIPLPERGKTLQRSDGPTVRLGLAQFGHHVSVDQVADQSNTTGLRDLATP